MLMKERGLNNARESSSPQTLNGVTTKVLSDIQLCRHSAAQRMDGSATREAHGSAVVSSRSSVLHVSACSGGLVATKRCNLRPSGEVQRDKCCSARFL